MKRMHLGSRSCRAKVKRNCRPAFTLVELLVVISIIGVLMGLLLPAVGAAREAMRRVECGSQIRQLALAAVMHDGQKGQLPSWCKKYGVFAGGSDPTEDAIPPAMPTNPPRHVKLGTWVVALLQYLDEQPTFEHWTDNRYPILNGSGGNRKPTFGRSGDGYHPFAAPNLGIMQCPSNPNANGTAGKNSYIGNCGLSHFRTTDSLDPMNSTAVAGPVSAKNPPVSVITMNEALAESMTTANTAFVNSYEGSRSGSTTASVGEGVGLSFITDGLGNTLLFSENVQAMPWHRVGFITPTLNTGSGLVITALTDEVDYAQTSRFAQGLVWHYEDAGATAIGGANCQRVYEKHKINGGGLTVSDDIFVLQMDANNCYDLARPSSAHTGGVNCGFADGSNRFVVDTIDYRVYQALLTPKGRKSSVPWPEFVLTEELF